MGYGIFIPEILTEFKDREDCKCYSQACGWRFEGTGMPNPRNHCYVFWPRSFKLYEPLESDSFEHYSKVVEDPNANWIWFVRDPEFVVPENFW
jgi:hypothetical protein